MAAGMGAPPKVFSSTPSPLQCESALGGERLYGELGRLPMAEILLGAVVLRVLAPAHEGSKTRPTGQEWELWSSGENELGAAEWTRHPHCQNFLGAALALS